MRASNWIQQADQAMIRAADRARDVAVRTHTSIHIMKDGEIVEIRPATDHPQPTPVQVREEAELSVVREDPPPYGSEKQ